MDDRLQTNRQAWDTMASVHVQGAPSYPVEEFKAGRAGLRPNTPDDLGSVRGKSLLHLQCHFGMDTLMWARQGASVTGVDFSPVAIAHARQLAADVHRPATFIESEISALPETLSGSFDIVLTYYGTIPWLPDLKPWAKVVARYLKPGGFFYVADTHPIAYLYEMHKGDARPRLVYDYFTYGKAQRFESQGGTYANPDAAMGPRVTYEWQHTIQEIVGCLTDAGLRIDFLHEFPYTFYDMFYRRDDEPAMQQDSDGWWWMKDNPHRLPLMFSLKASRL